MLQVELADIKLRPIVCQRLLVSMSLIRSLHLDAGMLAILQVWQAVLRFTTKKMELARAVKGARQGDGNIDVRHSGCK